MAIAANVLNALGGAPTMTGPEFVPSSPGLPADEHQRLARRISVR